jgi:hypothetical protein
VLPITPRRAASITIAAALVKVEFVDDVRTMGRDGSRIKRRHS